MTNAPTHTKPSTHTIRYELPSCRLHVTGPGSDQADQQEELTISELSGFQLQIIHPGFMMSAALYTGNKERLEALVSAVLPYSRHLVSGQPKRFGDDAAAVAILPWDRGHRLKLRSGVAGKPPIQLQLDDMELADMVRCLDLCLHDPRVSLGIATPPMRGLRKRELLNRQPWWRHAAAPVGGLSIVAAVFGLAMVVPVPERFLRKGEEPVTTEVISETEILPEVEVITEPDDGNVQEPSALQELPAPASQP